MRRLALAAAAAGLVLAARRISHAAFWAAVLLLGLGLAGSHSEVAQLPAALGVNQL